MNTKFEILLNMAIKWIEDFLPNLIGAVLILIIGIWLSGVIAKFVGKAMLKGRIGETVVTFTQSFLKISIKILTVIAALGTIGFNIASIITALGAATVAIGLALQDSLKNVASGIMILITKPFEVGDFIEISGLSGKVTKIDISNTHLLTRDNKEIIMPNSNVASGNIVNFSSQENRRVDFSFAVSYSSDLALVKKVVNKVIDSCPNVLTEPERFIAVGTHAENHLEIIVRLWCKKENYWEIYHYMQENVKLAFDENKISIPFPQIDVHNS